MNHSVTVEATENQKAKGGSLTTGYSEKVNLSELND